METSVEGAVRSVLRVLIDAGVAEVSAARPSLAEVHLHLIGNRKLKI